VAEAAARSAAVAEVAIGAGALDTIAGLYRRHFAGPALVIADENTWAAAGARARDLLTADGLVVATHVLPGRPRPKPTVELAEMLHARIEARAATPVAVGSGVINDLVKYAAFRAGRPYLCVATAASMDGYTSAGAPLAERGFKKTIGCVPARALLADLDVIAAAPPEMIGWGYGDLAGKVPAGADWILADALGLDPIDPTAWGMVQTDLRRWLARAAEARAGDRGAIEGLFAGLTLVGFAMEAHGSSRPASGADHQIAHLWEMEALEWRGERVSHGACVAVGCMAVLGLYERLLAHDLGAIEPAKLAAVAPAMADKERAIRAAFGPGEIAERALAETRAKHVGPGALERRLGRLRAIWPELSGRLRAQLMPAAEMAALLRAAGAPVAAEEIGVDAARLGRTIRAARFLRDRYTVLDLMDETGLLDAAVASVAPDPADRALRHAR
jgi:glycerol-1-phosphate dehydrogenase [NAD(P)+]